MNLIVIKSANSSVRTIPARNGKPALHFNEQTAAIETGEEFPRPFKITLDENQKPYAPGYYYVDPASFVVNKYDGLELGRRIKLSAMPSPPVK